MPPPGFQPPLYTAGYGAPTGAGAKGTIYTDMTNALIYQCAGGSTWMVINLVAQSFGYTVTGVEPDLSNLVIALPVAQGATTYRVTPAQEQFTNLLGMGVLTASKTTTQFTLSLSGAATTADKFSFIIS